MMDGNTLGSVAQTCFLGKIFSGEVLEKRISGKWNDSLQLGEMLWREDETVTRFRSKEDVEAFNKRHRAFSRGVRNFSWSYFPSKSVLIEYGEAFYGRREFFAYATPLLWTLRQFSDNIRTLIFNMSGDNLNSLRMLCSAIVLSSHLPNLKQLYFHKNVFVIGHAVEHELRHLGKRCRQNSRVRLEQLHISRWAGNGVGAMEFVVVPPLYFVAQCPGLTHSLLRLSITWPEVLMLTRYDPEANLPETVRNEPPTFPNLQRVAIRQPTRFCFNLFQYSPLQRVTFGFHRGTNGLVQRLQELFGMLDSHSLRLRSCWIDVEPEAIAALDVQQLAALQVQVAAGVRFPVMHFLTLRSSSAVLFPGFVRKLAMKFPRLQKIRLVSDNYAGRLETRNEFVNNETAVRICWENTNVNWVSVMLGAEGTEHRFSRPDLLPINLAPFPVLPD